MEFLLPNGEKLVIRPPELKDAALLLYTFQQLVGETDFLLTTTTEARQQTLRSEQEFIRAFRNNPGNLFLLATIRDRIIGTLSVTRGSWKKQAHAGEFGIAVLKDYWNLGIGRRLLTQMLRWAEKQESIHLLYCKVMAHNEKAIRLYRTFGFSEQGRLGRFFIQPDQSFADLVYMVLWIH